MLEVVIGPSLVQKQVEDHVAVIEKHPGGFAKSLDSQGPTTASMLCCFFNFFSDCGHLASVASRGNHKIIDDAKLLTNVKHNNLFAKLAVSRLNTRLDKCA